MISSSESKALVIQPKNNTAPHQQSFLSPSNNDAKKKYHCLCGTVHVATAARWIAWFEIVFGVCYSLWQLLAGAYLFAGRSLISPLLDVGILFAQRLRKPAFYYPYIVFNGAFFILFTVVLAVLIFATAFLPSDENAAAVNVLKVAFDFASKADSYGVRFEDVQKQFGINGVRLYLIFLWSFSLVVGAWIYSIVWRAWRYLQEQIFVISCGE